MTGKNFVLFLFALTLPLFITSCEQDEANTVASAQGCLDQAQNAAAASVCRSMVDGLTSASANLVRCSADFLSQGFSGTRIASAFQAMKNNTSGNDPAISIMSYLVFTSASPTTDLTVTDCTASGSLALQSLANAAQLATLTAVAGGGSLSGFDPTTTPAATLATNIETAITALAGASNGTLTSVGQTILNMQGTLCTAGSSVQNQSICTYVNSAVSSTDGSALNVAKKLVAILQTKY